MSALVAALYKDHATAEGVRISLVKEGFATDRVQLTSRTEPGAAGLTPSDDMKSQLRDYFGKVFPDANETEQLDEFVEAVAEGKAAVVVYPRGDVESQQALKILKGAEPLQMQDHDFEDQTMERAASHSGETMVGKVVPEGLKKTINPRKA